MQTKFTYGVLSGTILEIPEADIKLIDQSRVLFVKEPKKNCKKCYGRYFTGRDIKMFTYEPCACVRKVIDFKPNPDKIDEC